MNVQEGIRDPDFNGGGFQIGWREIADPEMEPAFPGNTALERFGCVQFLHPFLRRADDQRIPLIRFLVEFSKTPIVQIFKNALRHDRNLAGHGDRQLEILRQPHRKFGLVYKPAVREQLKLQAFLLGVEDLLKFPALLRASMDLFYEEDDLRFLMGWSGRLLSYSVSPAGSGRDQQDQSYDQASCCKQQSASVANQEAEHSSAAQNTDSEHNLFAHVKFPTSERQISPGTHR